MRQNDSHGESDVTHHNEGYFIQRCKNREFTYNIILRRFRATIFEVENNEYYILFMCVC